MSDWLETLHEIGCPKSVQRREAESAYPRKTTFLRQGQRKKKVPEIYRTPEVACSYRLRPMSGGAELAAIDRRGRFFTSLSDTSGLDFSEYSVSL